MNYLLQSKAAHYGILFLEEEIKKIGKTIEEGEATIDEMVLNLLKQREKELKSDLKELREWN